MAPVRVGVEQAHGERLDPVRDGSDRGADGVLVDRLDDRAVRADPLRDLADVARVGEGLRLLVDHEAEERTGRPGLGEVEDLPEAARDDEPHERAAPLEHRVRGDGRAVQHRVEVGQADVCALGREADARRSRRPTGRAAWSAVFASQTCWPSLS